MKVYFSPANGWIYKKVDGRAGTGLIWLRIRTREQGDELPGFVK
jgi:hypothetical protein